MQFRYLSSGILGILLVLTVSSQAEVPSSDNEGDGAYFRCSVSTSSSRPTSVHRLRPSDIEVIGAIGDSITAGTGIFARTLIGVLVQYRGHSYTMGGEGSLSKMLTLPNILKKFNRNLEGYSVGTGGSSSSGANFNVAIVGDIASDMPGQARRLVERMRDTLGDRDFREKWKLINIFIGGNDICRYCFDHNKYSPANYSAHLQSALDYLKANSPRTFVNMISPVDASAVADIVESRECKQLYIFCPCAALRPQHQVKQYVDELQEKTEELGRSGRYDTSDDFTVVVQPFMKDTSPPTKGRRIDLSYFSPDCFHYGSKLHELSAMYLWRNMLEPVGRKTEEVDYSSWLSVDCPSSGRPYLATSKNS